MRLALAALLSVYFRAGCALRASLAPRRPQLATHCEGGFPPGAVGTEGSMKQAVVYLEGAYADALGPAHQPLPSADAHAIQRSANASGPADPINCGEGVYGEIPPGSAAELFRHEAVRLGRSDTFFDLGAGLGGLAVAAAVLGDASHAVGVELAKSRFDLGCGVLSDVERDISGMAGTNTSGGVADGMNRVDLRLGDLFEVPDLKQATVVYVANFCFRKAMMQRLARRLRSELALGTRLIVLRAFDAADVRPHFGLRNLVKVAQTSLPMTWSLPGYENALYIYRVE